jgi:hypothetical protein
MTQYTELGKKSGGRSIFKKLLCSILGIIFVIIVAAASLYIYLRIAKTTEDNVAAISSAETMPASERYSFDASSLKMEISIDKSDLWWLLEQFNYEDTIAELTDNLKLNGFTLQSYGLDITNKGVFISAEITYGNSLRIPLKILMNTTFKDGTLIISPARLYLGKIGLYLEKFPLNRLVAGSGIDPDFHLDEYTFKIPLSDWNLMTMLTDIYFKDSRMVMVYKLDESLFSISKSAYRRDLDRFASEYTNCIEVLREYSTKGALGERFASLVKEFGSNPDSFPDFIAESLALSNESDSKEYLNKNGPWLARFMPEITEKSVSDSHASLYKLCEERSSLFNKLLDTLLASYNSLEFGIDERGLTYNDKPFDLESFMGDEWKQYSSWLDTSSFRPVLVDSINVDDTKTPLLSKITNSMKYFDNVASLNRKIPLGFIVKMQDGTPVLKYLSVAIAGKEDKAVTIHQEVVLDNAEFESMIKNSLMPVWRH